MSVATGLQVRTETITMTDMNQSCALIAPHCMSQAVEVRVKPVLGTSWGKQIITDREKSSEFPPHSITFLRSHYIISTMVYRHYGEELFSVDCRDEEEMYIHFMVISQREKCTLAAGALAPVPIVLKR